MFTYGSLSPGGSMNRLFDGTEGYWQPAQMKGKLYPEGSAFTEGYPVVDISIKKEWVKGSVYCSQEIEKLLPDLDAYEGPAYRRAVETVELIENKQIVDAYVYVSAEQIDIES